MTKVYINRDPISGPWGGGNLWVSSVHSQFPNMGFEIVGPNEDPDVVLVAGLTLQPGHMSAADAIHYKAFMKSKGKNVRLILRVNANDASKNTTGLDKFIYEVSSYCDHVVFVSYWLEEYFGASNWKVPTSVIHNGVDTETFKPNKKKVNGKINIVTHHWSDNFMKGFDVYEAIDDWLEHNSDFTFTYIGRDRKTFRNAKTIKPLFGRKLGEELSRYDVYVSGSKFDSGPNHVIESIACGIPTYVHCDGGGGVEFAGSSHAYTSINEILNILSGKEYDMNDAWTPSSWHACVEKFAHLASNEK